MKMFATGVLSLFLAIAITCSQATAGIMPTVRANLGSDAGKFFDPASGFTAGDTSHTNTVSVTDSGIKMDVTITIEGFDSSGAPAALSPVAGSVGVDSPPPGNDSESTRLNPTESIKVTFDTILFTLSPPAPGLIVDPSSTGLLSSVALGAFGAGDSFTYSGVGDAGASLSGNILDISETISDGDMFTITATGGEFRLNYISLSGTADIIPEPTTATLGLAAASGCCLPATSSVARRIRETITWESRLCETPFFLRQTRPIYSARRCAIS